MSAAHTPDGTAAPATGAGDDTVVPHQWTEPAIVHFLPQTSCTVCGCTIHARAQTTGRRPATPKLNAATVAALAVEQAELDADGCLGPLHRPLTADEVAQLTAARQEADALRPQIAELSATLSKLRAQQHQLLVTQPLELIASLLDVPVGHLDLLGRACPISPAGQCVLVTRVRPARVSADHTPDREDLDERLSDSFEYEACVYCHEPTETK